MARRRLVVVSALFAATACGLPSSAVAPEACGFPEGAALAYAGRSTTAALGVQEVLGDPMSDDPADIYVTRDAFDQGERRGRLVCAIYVDQPGFVEVTLHPADVEPVVEEPEPAASAPPDGISRGLAVDAARNAVEDADEWEVAAVGAGPLGQLLPEQVVPDWATDQWAHDLSADLWVWRVFLVRDDRGVEVFVDFVDGSVYGTRQYIVN